MPPTPTLSRYAIDYHASCLGAPFASSSEVIDLSIFRYTVMHGPTKPALDATCTMRRAQQINSIPLLTMHQRLGYLFASSILRGRWFVQFQKHCDVLISETFGCPLHDQRSQQVTKDQLHMFAHHVSASGSPLASSNFSHTAIPGPTRPLGAPYSHTVTSCSDSTNRSPCLRVSGSCVCVLFRGL